MSIARSWRPVASPGAAPVGNFSAGARAGDLIFTSGQIPQDPATGEIRADLSLTEQAALVFGNMGRVLEGAGASLEDVVSVTVYLADIDDWPEFNEFYATIFSAPFPARAVVGAGLERFRIEASAIAVAPSSADRSDIP